MIDMTTIVGSVIVVLFFGLMVWFLWPRRPKLNPQGKQRMLASWKRVMELPDSHRRILEADKVLDQALFDLGFKGSTGDKLKKAGKYIPNLQALWNAHKLRNRVAHEQNITISKQEEDAALAAFQKALTSFVKN